MSQDPVSFSVTDRPNTSSSMNAVEKQGIDTIEGAFDIVIEVLAAAAKPSSAFGAFNPVKVKECERLPGQKRIASASITKQVRE